MGKDGIAINLTAATPSKFSETCDIRIMYRGFFRGRGRVGSTYFQDLVTAGKAKGLVLMGDEAFEELGSE